MPCTFGAAAELLPQATSTARKEPPYSSLEDWLQTPSQLEPFCAFFIITLSVFGFPTSKEEQGILLLLGPEGPGLRSQVGSLVHFHAYSRRGCAH